MKYIIYVILALMSIAFCQEAEIPALKDSANDSIYNPYSKQGIINRNARDSANDSICEPLHKRKPITKTADTILFNYKQGTYSEGILNGRIDGMYAGKQKDYTNTSCLLTSFLGIIGAGACYMHADQDEFEYFPNSNEYSLEYCLGYQDGYNNGFKSIRKKQATSGIMKGMAIILTVSAFLIIIPAVIN